MNNTKNILLIALITATLVLGTTIIPMQSYAGESKNTKDSKSSIKASTEVDKKSSSQKMDQDNFCYRGDDCEQANQGQQIVGKDNDANGFNDQSKNLALSTSGAGAGTGTGNGTTPTPTPTRACEECFTTAFAGLDEDTVRYIIERFGATESTIDSVCDVPAFSANFVEFVLTTELELYPAIAVSLLDCLRDAGVRVTA